MCPVYFVNHVRLAHEGDIAKMSGDASYGALRGGIQGFRKPSPYFPHEAGNRERAELLHRLGQYRQHGLDLALI